MMHRACYIQAMALQALSKKSKQSISDASDHNSQTELFLYRLYKQVKLKKYQLNYYMMKELDIL